MLKKLLKKGRGYSGKDQVFGVLGFLLVVVTVYLHVDAFKHEASAEYMNETVNLIFTIVFALGTISAFDLSIKLLFPDNALRIIVLLLIPLGFGIAYKYNFFNSFKIFSVLFFICLSWIFLIGLFYFLNKFLKKKKDNNVDEEIFQENIRKIEKLKCDLNHYKKFVEQVQKLLEDI